MVCALLFLKPMIVRLLGASESPWRVAQARLANALPANDQRQDYVRCHIVSQPDGSEIAEAFPVQDSSMLRTYAFADGLIVRPPGDPARVAGDVVSVLHLS
jgi:molybdopterin molybdotransferase